MGRYTLLDLQVCVQPDGLERRAQLAELFPKLSLPPAGGAPPKSSHDISIFLEESQKEIPPLATLRFQADGFSGFQHDESYYLTDGSSVFHLEPGSRRGHAYLTPDFFSQSQRRQGSFWTFALLKLLRPLGFFSLHSAGLVTPDGDGVVVIGPSGSGKSTLTLGLIRQGWRYLSDDAILLHIFSGSVRARALRRHFYIDACATTRHIDLPFDDPQTDNTGGQKCRVRMEDTPFAAQQVTECLPRVLLRSRIVPEGRSSLVPLNQGEALKELLEAGGQHLFDRETMAQHFHVLNVLLHQCAAYELRAGRDVYANAAIAIRLLNEALAKEAAWPALSPS